MRLLAALLFFLASCAPIVEYSPSELAIKYEEKFDAKVSKDWLYVRTYEWVHYGAGLWKSQSLMSNKTLGKLIVRVKVNEDISPLYSDHLYFVMDFEFLDGGKVNITFANPWVYKDGLLWVSTEQPVNMEAEFEGYKKVAEKLVKDYKSYIESAAPNKNFDKQTNQENYQLMDISL